MSERKRKRRTATKPSQLPRVIDHSLPQANQQHATKETGEYTGKSSLPCGLMSSQPPPDSNARRSAINKKTFLNRLSHDIRKPKAYVEVAALVLLAIYTCETHRTNALTESALEIGQRAYLAYGLVDQIPSGIKIHLSNIGHVPTKVTRIFGHYLRVSYPQNVTLDNLSREKMAPNIDVAPGSDSDAAVLLDLPALQPDDTIAVNAGHQILTIDAALDYETGFHRTDRLNVTLVYDREVNKWVRVNRGAVVNLRPEDGNRTQQK